MFKTGTHQLNKNADVFHKYRIYQVIFFALCITFIIEIIQRKSIMEGIGFAIKNPIIFFLNMFIVLFTLSLSCLFTRKQFMLYAISVIWLGLGIVNGIITCFRLTPLSAMDFYLVGSFPRLVPGYFNILFLILILILGLTLIGGVVWLWRKAAKVKLSWMFSIMTIIVSAALVYLFSLTATNMKVLPNHFDNLHDAYKQYGFVYCFSNSILNRGIEEPGDYSKEKMEELLHNITDASKQQASGVTSKNKEIPNIIMVQLESFFDTSLLKNYAFSENPVPNYTKLKEDFTSGYLKVPVYGAGTVNTEFEVITGMSTEFFGTGEYPYRTILASNTSESICYNLTKLGYHNYVIHNNAASFYKRNEVFKMLGFDNFVSMEYMNHIELNPIGWARDQVLTQEIMKALNAKDSKDFIYTISVQDHGIYPDISMEENHNIKVSIKPNLKNMKKEKTEESYLNQLAYYVNQVKDTDKFIGDLTNALKTYKEPTVVVFYGDHLPPLSFDNEDLINDRYETEYVMWSNFSLERERHDLTAYQLNAYVLERIGINEGIITQFHQASRNQPNYKDQLKLLQYDMLYGKKYVYGGKNPYPVKDMKMGIYEQIIKSMETKDGLIFIYGENFTPFSRVCINDKVMDTEFINENTLSIKYRDLTNKELSIAQVNKSNTVLSKSALWK